MNASLIYTYFDKHFKKKTSLISVLQMLLLYQKWNACRTDVLSTKIKIIKEASTLDDNWTTASFFEWPSGFQVWAQQVRRATFLDTSIFFHDLSLTNCSYEGEAYIATGLMIALKILSRATSSIRSPYQQVLWVYDRLHKIHACLCCNCGVADLSHMINIVVFCSTLCCFYIETNHHGSFSRYFSI